MATPTATAGTPGTTEHVDWSPGAPNQGPAAYDLALKGHVTAIPATAWAVGEYIEAPDGTPFYWGPSPWAPTQGNHWTPGFARGDVRADGTLAPFDWTPYVGNIAPAADQAHTVDEIGTEIGRYFRGQFQTTMTSVDGDIVTLDDANGHPHSYEAWHGGWRQLAFIGTTQFFTIKKGADPVYEIWKGDRKLWPV